MAEYQLLAELAELRDAPSEAHWREQRAYLAVAGGEDLVRSMKPRGEPVIDGDDLVGPRSPEEELRSQNVESIRRVPPGKVATVSACPSEQAPVVQTTARTAGWMGCASRQRKSDLATRSTTGTTTELPN